MKNLVSKLRTLIYAIVLTLVSFFVLNSMAVDSLYAGDLDEFEEVEDIEIEDDIQLVPVESKMIQEKNFMDSNTVDVSSKYTNSLEGIDENEIVRRKEKELEADQLYMDGRKSFIQGDYETAVRKFISAQVKLTEVSRSEERVVKKQKLIDQLLAFTYEEWAERIAKDAKVLVKLDKFEDAIEKYQKVIEKDPGRKKEIYKKISSLRNSIKQAEFKERTSAKNVDPEKATRDTNIDIKLAQGKVYFNNKRYSDAREMFEQVILKDPYNISATQFLKRINEKLIDAAAERHKVMVSDRMAEVKWKWNDPVAPLVSPDIVVESSQPVKKMLRGGEGIWSKLENIIIPKIIFEEAGIHSVIKYLKSRSRELDPDGEGVNIFLQLSIGTASQGVEEDTEDDSEDDLEFEDFDDEQEDEEDEEDEEDSSSGGEITITMDFDNIPLGEAIRYICQGAGLKYKVETHAIIIASQDIPFDELETRFYPIEAGFLKAKATLEARGGLEGVESGNKKGLLDPKALFQGYGVDFPAGAKITFDQRTSKLIVTNTPANLRKVEKVLVELNIQPVQVTIEAKFIEIAQNDLEELGFEWAFKGEVVKDQNNPDVLTFDGQGGPDFKLSNNFVFKPIGNQSDTSTENISKGLRFLGNDEFLKVNSIIGDLMFDTIIHALEQKDSTEVLSSPKITTVSGETAIIKVIEEHFFPESFTEPELQAAVGGVDNASGATIKPSTPEFGAATEVGVILTVTPTVASDGYSIELDLEPQVVEADKDINDSYNYTVNLGGDDFEVKVERPIVSRRLIQTRVIVWDGETVVLGGMIRENVISRDDKIPFLGDIPVFGRLFKNESENSRKTNLLIFVTARLVNPAGLPIRTADIRGLPDFRR